MKMRFFYLICSILFISINTYSQKKLDKFLNVQYKLGFAILNNGDTLNGPFEFNNCEKNYQILVYVNPTDFSKKAYNPQEVKFFALDSTYYLPKELKDGWVFVQLISNDKLGVYLYKRFLTTQMGSGSENQLMLEKPNGQYILVPLNNFFPFKFKVSDFFSDDEELSTKILNETYKRKDIIKIAYDYNNWLKEHNK
ncbi:MAG: hypothetical protein PHR83_12480 [Paludibacter sp.]|nr:hypothetical protein [Paludibacter sp.]